MRQGFLGQFLPHDLTDQASILLARTLAFSAICSVVIGLYSCIKWGRLGNDVLMYGSLLLVLGMPLMLLVMRSAVLPLSVAANMALASMASYSMLLIYQLGGLNSAHIYWPAVIIVFSYLLSGTRSAMFWSLVQALFVFWLIRLERTGASLPVFELSPRDEAVNLYSGFILPVLTVWLAQWYSANLRSQALSDAQTALRESREFGQRAAQNQTKLASMVDEVRSTAGDLLQMAGQLQQTLGGIRQRCQSIDQDVQHQADAMQQLDLSLHDVLASLASSTGHMQQLSQDTQHSSGQVNACAERMHDAQTSMQAIQQSNQRIAESMQMISAIAQQTNLLALNAAIEAARAGRLSAAEMQGGCFTITNLGGFGIEAFTPIINYPEVAVLGLGAIIWEAAALEDGTLTSRQLMTLSLTFDHRILDGAPAARFLQTLRQRMEEPFAWLF